MIFELISTAFMNLVQAYRDRVQGDSGTIVNSSLTQDAILFYKRNNLYDSIKFGWMSGAGSKKRTSTIYSYFAKLYSFGIANDAVQSTESSEPRVTGNIAPGDTEALQNQNGESRFMTHPTISFGANEAWSVTTVLNFNGNNDQISTALCSDITQNNKSAIYLGQQNQYYRLNFINSIGTSYSTGNVYPNYDILGKNIILTIIADGAGNLNYYKNGILYVSISAVTSVNISSILISELIKRYPFYSEHKSYLIRNIALTPSEVLQEATFLSSKYPEIPSVQIGAQTWALRNCDQVASTNGTVIPDGNVAATWDDGTSFWCFHTSVDVGSWAGKLYNKAARDVLIANPPAGWHVPTEAELTTLAANGGNSLKKDGTSYWTTTGGTNSTGFTALGGSSRNADGSFNTIKNTASFWCADSDKVLVLNHDDNTATITAVTSVNDGHSIRLIKD